MSVGEDVGGWGIVVVGFGLSACTGAAFCSGAGISGKIGCGVPAIGAAGVGMNVCGEGGVNGCTGAAFSSGVGISGEIGCGIPAIGGAGLGINARGEGGTKGCTSKSSVGVEIPVVAGCG